MDLSYIIGFIIKFWSWLQSSTLEVQRLFFDLLCQLRKDGHKDRTVEVLKCFFSDWLRFIFSHLFAFSLFSLSFLFDPRMSIFPSLSSLVYLIFFHVSLHLTWPHGLYLFLSFLGLTLDSFLFLFAFFLWEQLETWRISCFLFSKRNI